MIGAFQFTKIDVSNYSSFKIQNEKAFQSSESMKTQKNQ